MPKRFTRTRLNPPRTSQSLDEIALERAGDDIAALEMLGDAYMQLAKTLGRDQIYLVLMRMWDFLQIAVSGSDTAQHVPVHQAQPKIAIEEIPQPVYKP